MMAYPTTILICAVFSILTPIHADLKMNYAAFPYNRIYTQQDPVDNSLFGFVNLRSESEKISDHLRNITNRDLAVYTLQTVFDSLTYTSSTFNMAEQLEKVVGELDSKILRYKRVLTSTKSRIESLYQFHKRKTISEPLSCCSIKNGYYLRDSGDSQTSQSSSHTTCDFLPLSYNNSMFNPGRNLSAVYSLNLQQNSMIKWQYFISTDGIHNIFPAHNLPISLLDCRVVQNRYHRDAYTHTLSQTNRNVVIVVDVSTVLSNNLIKTVKQLANLTLLSLNENDKVTVITLSKEVVFPPISCHTLLQATSSNIQFLLSYVNSVSISNTQANHTLGMNTAFATLADAPKNGMIMYISRGLMNSLAEAKDVLNVISKWNSQLNSQVVINTFGLIDDGRSVMYEKTFLNDISTQNFDKYAIVYNDTVPPVKPGISIIVNNPDRASEALNKIFISNTLNEDAVYLSPPTNDLFDQGLIISMSTPVTNENETVGMAGLDLHLRDLIEDITNVKSDVHYAFLIDTQGNVLVHPSIEPVLTEDLNAESFLHFSHYENLSSTSELVTDILTMSNASFEIPTENNTTDRPITYAWRHLTEAPYIVVIKYTEKLVTRQEIQTMIQATDSNSNIYHRLDLNHAPTACLHFQQLASFNSSALFISAQAFEKPYEHLWNPETKRMVTNYLTYIWDKTNYISKPGLKSGVKEAALSISSKITYEWMEKYRTSQYSPFIVRRFVATPTGVMRMYPALLTSKDYNPTQTHWYRKAINLPGYIVMSRPYIDTAGAGFIVTISYTVYEGRTATLHTRQDPVLAVVGADITMSYFMRILYEHIPACQAQHMRCALIDDNGYVIAHPGLKAAGRINERHHITHIEPLIASDILGHKQLVTKRSCNNYVDGTVQRYYQFNTSLAETVTNLKAGEQCLRYQMSAVPFTNTFVIMINETCTEKPSAFCPCSRTDRLCLNCNRMEQSECECPCECSIKRDYCNTGSDELPACEQFSPNNILFQLPAEVVQKIPQCQEPQCSKYNTKYTCMGIVGCSWCEMDSDNLTPLNTPRCDKQQICFDGVIGSRTPYNDQITSTSISSANTDVIFLKNTPIGPVTGAILGLFLVLILGVYCYKQNANRRARIQRENRDSPLDYNTEQNGYMYHELPAVAGPSYLQPPGHANLLEMDDPANISPYHLNVNYQPPRPVVTATESSDHGYSTMTPHDDGETSSTSCIESIVPGKAKQHTPSIKLFPAPKSSLRKKVLRKDSECRRLLQASSTIPEMDLDEQERVEILAT